MTHRGVTGIAVGVVLGACAARPTPARFASWEPTSPQIPTSSPADARRRLAESRRLYAIWRDGPDPDRRTVGRTTGPIPHHGYTYIRAQEVADHVEFTIVAVVAGRVVVRALLRADPDRMDGLELRESTAVASAWVERGAELGRHDDGAPPLTLDALYERCAATIAAHPNLRPRLYFHPNGLLMHCGFLPDECDDCPTIAVQSFSRFAVVDEAPGDPRKWVCTMPWGAVAPGSETPWMSDLLTCQAALYPHGRPRRKRRPKPGSASICDIDPKACPDVCDSIDCTRAYWSRGPSLCGGGWPSHDPQRLDVGKLEPMATWTFPFSSGGGVECEGEGRAERRVLPVQPPAR